MEYIKPLQFVLENPVSRYATRFPLVKAMHEPIAEGKWSKFKRVLIVLEDEITNLGEKIGCSYLLQQSWNHLTKFVVFKKTHKFHRYYIRINFKMLHRILTIKVIIICIKLKMVFGRWR